jgi:hypothetical protein
LKSLDSDERIQGNPRKSKEIQGNPTRFDGGFPTEIATDQENPKGR